MSLTFPVHHVENDGGSVLVQFKAGKCKWDGHIVSPDPRKGLLLLVNGDDGLTHVKWKDRTSENVEDDLIVVNDAYLSRVPECTSGRVYLLRFTSSEKKILYWMQEYDDTKDTEFITEFNKYTKCSPDDTSTQNGSAKTTQSLPLPTETNELQSQLADALRKLSTRKTSCIQPKVTLEFATRGALAALENDFDCVKELQTMMPLGYATEKDVKETLHCPQLSSGLSSLNHAIQSDLPTLLTYMGIPNPQPLDPNDDPLESFAEILERMYSGKDDKQNDSS